MSDNKLKSLVDIFNNKVFRIPDFQRGYSWQEKELLDFWNDINNLKGDRVHYTGLLTVEPINKSELKSIEKWKDDLWLMEKGFTPYYIIDGQQRITTAIILINEILEQFKEGEGINYDKKEAWIQKFLYEKYGEEYKSYIFGYEKDDPSDEYFKTKVLKQKSSYSDKVPEQTLYTSNLNFAKSFFKKRLDKKNKEELESLYKKLINKLKFNFYEIDDELDVFVTFETMNNRGKPLSNLELLKNRLIYLSTILDDDDQARERVRKDINESWKTIYEYLGKNKDRKLDDDTFLYNHWIMYFKYDRSRADAYANYLLNDLFTADNVLHKKISLATIKQYIDSLAESVKVWYYIYNIEQSTYNTEVKEWVKKLNRLGLSAFPPILMAAMIKEPDETQLLNLLKAAEQFNFLVFKITQRSSNTKNSHFYRLAHDYYWDPNKTTRNITDDIHWHCIGHYDNDEYAGWTDLWRFKSHIKDLFSKSEGYYSWNGLKYFLYEYELYLQSKAKGNAKVSWSELGKYDKEDTIEHIYPRTATKECWKEAFKNENKIEKKQLLHSLGNLLLLQPSKNSSLRNNCFDFKKKHEKDNGERAGYFNGSYSEIDVCNYDKWTAEEIYERGIKMLDFLEKRWNIDISEWEIDKKSLLTSVQTKTPTS